MSGNDNDPAGDLLIREVDDELRQEFYLNLWRRYGKLAAAGAVALVLGVAGHQGWQTWQARERDKASQALKQADDRAAADDVKGAADALQALEKTGPEGYRVMAAMRRADLLAGHGDPAGAASVYDQLSQSGAPSIFRDLAAIKFALLTLDSGDPAKLTERISPLAKPDNPWHYPATEILALLARRQGQTDHARDLYKQLADDLGAPADIRARAAEMLAATAPGSTRDSTKG